MVHYENEVSPGLSENSHAEVLYGYGEHGVRSPIVIDRSSDTLTVGSSSITSLALPPAIAATIPTVSPDDFAAPPPLSDAGSYYDDETLGNNTAHPDTGHITPSQRGIAVTDPSNGAEYIEYTSNSEEDVPELSSGSSADSPQLDDTSERSIRGSSCVPIYLFTALTRDTALWTAIRTSAQFSAPSAAPWNIHDDYQAAVLACDKARQEAQRLDEENKRLDICMHGVIQEVGQCKSA